MSKDGKKGVMPRLRFSEFSDAGEWEVKKLEDLIETVTPPKKLKTSDYLEYGAFPVIDQSQGEICGWTNDEDAVISERLPLVVFGDHTCKIKLEDKPFAQGADGIKILAAEKDIDPRFLYQFLLSSPVEQKEYQRHFSVLKDKLVPFPRRDSGEQQKIADSLFSVDEVIDIEAKKLDALKAHKKGLMQQLFPREGETTPSLRFFEFRDKGKWEMLKIEDFSKKLVQGGTPSTSVSEYWNGPIPWITPAEMGDDAEHHYTTKTVRTISEKGLANSSAEILPENSVIISSRAPIGYATVNKVEMATNQGCKGIVPNSKAHYEFLYFSLLTASRHLNDLGAGAGFKEISASTLRAVRIPIPRTQEQQKIADCLTSIDELIVFQAQKLDALKAHKKGLMQQLFPTEVS